MEIVLYLGAHKTASTYLQKCLAQSHMRLAQDDIVVQGPRELRPYLASWATDPYEDASARATDALSWLIDTAEDRGISRLVLSDEQFLGTLNPLLSGGYFFGNLQRNLEPLIRALQGRPFEAVMAVRNYAQFFASAYCQVVRGSGFRRFNREIRDHFLDHPRGWAEVTGEIAKLCPRGTPIKLWRYEDFGVLEDDVFRLLVGPAGDQCRRIGGRPLARPAHRALDILHEQADRGIVPTRTMIRETFSSHPATADSPRFDPWSEDEHAFFEARYRQDLIALSVEPACQWLLPADEEVA